MALECFEIPEAVLYRTKVMLSAYFGTTEGLNPGLGDKCFTYDQPSSPQPEKHYDRNSHPESQAAYFNTFSVNYPAGITPRKETQVRHIWSRHVGPRNFSIHVFCPTLSHTRSVRLAKRRVRPCGKDSTDLKPHVWGVSAQLRRIGMQATIFDASCWACGSWCGPPDKDRECLDCLLEPDSTLNLLHLACCIWYRYFLGCPKILLP